jgi:hypothetical protein
MSNDRPEFADLMIEAHRAMPALDDFTKRDGSKAMNAAVNDGQRVYSQLLNSQQTSRLTMEEANRCKARWTCFGRGCNFLGRSVTANLSAALRRSILYGNQNANPLLPARPRIGGFFLEQKDARTISN